MSYNDKPWNSERNTVFRGPHNFPGRPEFRGRHENVPVQQPRNPHIVLPPPPQQQQQQQFQNYSNRPEPPFISGGSSLYMPRHSQFQPPLPPPPMTLSNSTSYQDFSMPPPRHNVPGIGQPLPFPHNTNVAQSKLPGLDMNYGAPPLPVQRPFQQMPTNLPFPQIPPQQLQHGGTSYQPVIQTGIINSQPGISNCKQMLDNKEMGAQIIDKWLQKTGKSKRLQFKDPPKLMPSEQLWKSVDQLRDMTQLISSMSDQLKEVTDCASSASSATWETKTNKLEELKDKFISLEPLLDEPSIQSVEKKLIKIRHKRERLRRARASKFEEEQRVRESWMEKSQQIDKWQQRHIAQIKEENLRKSRKAAADRTLSKVTREIQDASRLIETMLALQKLRLIRRDAAQKRGDTDLGESRQTFEQKIADMTRLVQSQLECYKEEEAKLKQIIKSEEEKDTEKERMVQIEKQKQKQRDEDEELQRMLFGLLEEITDSDPKFPYYQYYRQAETSLQAFLQIRHEWDSFLVPENTPTSSVIPNTWILPEPPSSATWATALK